MPSTIQPLRIYPNKTLDGIVLVVCYINGSVECFKINSQGPKMVLDQRQAVLKDQRLVTAYLFHEQKNLALVAKGNQVYGVDLINLKAKSVLQLPLMTSICSLTSRPDNAFDIYTVDGHLYTWDFFSNGLKQDTSRFQLELSSKDQDNNDNADRESDHESNDDDQDEMIYHVYSSAHSYSGLTDAILYWSQKKNYESFFQTNNSLCHVLIRKKETIKTLADHLSMFIHEPSRPNLLYFYWSFFVGQNVVECLEESALILNSALLIEPSAGDYSAVSDKMLYLLQNYLFVYYALKVKTFT